MTNEEFVEQYEQDLNHIYDLFGNICTFKKVPFSANDNWTQYNNGIFKLQLPCSEYLVLAAFEKIDGASDIRVNCESGIKYSTVIHTEPINGYLVVAVVDYDDDDILDGDMRKEIDSELNQSSVNPVTNRAITKAIKALEQQVTNVQIPDSLPASDVYAWAKSKNKPVYTWNEISAKPTVVTSITYKGTALPYTSGQVSLDTINDYIQHPTKLSEFEKDINLFDLQDGAELANRLNSINDSVSTLSTRVINNKNDLDNVISTLSAKETNDYTELLGKINDNYSSTTRLINTFNTDLSTKIENYKTSYISSLNALKANVINNYSTLNSAINTVKSDTGIALNQHSSDILSLKSQVDTLTTNIAGIDIGYVDRKIEFLQEAYITPNQTKIEEVKQSVKTVSDKQSELELSVATLSGTFAGSSSKVEANEQAIANLDASVNQSIGLLEDDVDDLKETVENLQSILGEGETTGLVEKVEKNKTDIANLDTRVTANYNAINALSDRIETIPENIKSVEIKASANNGYINVNNEDIKVYEAESVVVPTKLSDLENDVDFITADDMNVNYEFTKYPITTTKGMEYNEYVNITKNSGNVYLNGENINLNQSLIEALQEKVATLETQLAQSQADLTALTAKHTNELLIANAYISQLQTTINKNNGTIAVLQDSINELWNYVGDPDRRFDERDVPLVDKQDKIDAVTDSDAMTASDIQDIYNGIE